MPETDISPLDKALQLHKSGQLQAAEAAYRQILQDNPADRDALNNLGILLRMQGRLNEALIVLQQLTSLNPDFPEAWNSYGRALTAAGRTQEALTVLNKALTINPDLVAVHLNIAHAHESNGDIDQATKALHRYLKVEPDNPEALARLGCYLYALGHGKDALQALTRSNDLAPDNADTLINLAMVQEQLGHYGEAVASRTQALGINPHDAECFSDLAISLERLGRIEDAIAARREAVDLAPQVAGFMGDLGRLLTENGADEEAGMWFDRALAVDPQAARVHFNKALFLLRRGEFEAGWAEHEWRLKFSSLADIFPEHSQPYWDGSDLAGKTIFLHGEQGWGDTIQCARFIYQVSQLAGRVVLGIREPLARLFECLPGVDQIITDPLDLPHFDVRCSLLSLPYFFKADLTSIPDTEPYLTAPGNRPAFVDKDNFNIGLVWGGSPTHKNDHNRSVSLSILKPLLDIKGCVFHSLQVDDRRQDIGREGLSEQITDAGADLVDLADTADLIMELDLVITVDTSVAHLAAALGKPVWIMLAEPADWRWLRDRDDSPWYSGVQLFRQTKRGEWADVIELLVARLPSLLAHQDV
ncbi:MAG: tetratricopeptide repeat protein [Alphaproteobacteria bacterium]|nr:tetratricopeptide repeat protein [Alphaproteobacteria bacterium]MBT5917038.1 tetratricopeptide repeat protein [Alphaproteobacteria bacterium]MBT6386986.1 tetratricopeptide repeat protein [Alphaproteobacteria bacterium]